MMDTRWKMKAVFLRSSDLSDKFFPSVQKMSTPAMFIGLKDSTAMGTKRYVLEMSMYFLILILEADSAAAAEVTLVSGK